MQNRELTNAVSALNESLKIVNQNFANLQRFVESNVARWEAEQIEVKNRVSYIESKRRRSSRSKSKNNLPLNGEIMAAGDNY